MTSYYKINYRELLNSECYTEASKEELRVLLALAAADGVTSSVAALAQLASVSEARCASALTLWTASGVICERESAGGDTRAAVIDEFEQDPLSPDFDEQTAQEAADSIRNRGLSDLINECTVLMDKAALNTQEIKKITSLVTQYALTEDFILTLAAHLREKDALTVRRLFDKAVSLVEKGIDKTDRLEKYIIECESSSTIEWELRHIFGIYSRALTKKQKYYFKRWTEEFGYSAAVIGEAYNITVDSKGVCSFPYVDAILTKWYESGCRTAEECIAKHETEKAAISASYKTKGESSKRDETASTPKYADFDTEEALMRALQRSYGENNE